MIQLSQKKRLAVKFRTPILNMINEMPTKNKPCWNLEPQWKFSVFEMSHFYSLQCDASLMIQNFITQYDHKVGTMFGWDGFQRFRRVSRRRFFGELFSTRCFRRIFLDSTYTDLCEKRVSLWAEHKIDV